MVEALRKLAELSILARVVLEQPDAAKEDYVSAMEACAEFAQAADDATVLALIGEVERLTKALEQANSAVSFQVQEDGRVVMSPKCWVQTNISAPELADWLKSREGGGK